MLDSFLTFINQHTPDLKQQPTLLAVSGGIDSVVMTHLFHSLGFAAGIAHCNFGLRGEESNEDEAFVKELAGKYGFPFFVTKPDVKALATSASISTQMAARELRYEWFENIRVSVDYQWIATAHHANDSLETLLLNLARGTGLPGLCGIAPVNGHLIRPMLFSSREQVRQYALENGIQWREDRTNQTDDYQRNKIRHQVIPVLSELNPSLEATFNASAERLRSANVLLDEYLQIWKFKVIQQESDTIRIPIEEILGKSEPAYRLWAILQDFGFQYSQMRGIVTALTGISGKQFLSPSHVLLIDRADLILRGNVKPQDQDELIIGTPEGTFDYLGMTFTFNMLPEGAPLNFDRLTIAVDADKLIFPLRLRKWQQGDSFQPFGMSGKTKKVSDLLTDRKIDRFQKEQTGILLNGNGEVIWVVGVRADERFRVEDDSRNVLVLSVAIR